MRSHVRVALDAMGSDSRPVAEIRGAVEAMRRHGAEVVLVGNERTLIPEVDRLADAVPLRIHHAPDVVRMEDPPTQVLRDKPRSSLAIALELAASGEADAVVSAGNSGALLCCAMAILGKVDGVDRPAIGAEVPTLRGRTVLSDAGANTGCRPHHLLTFARLTSAAKALSDPWGTPRVGLLCNGTEPGKGTSLTRGAYELLSRSELDFVGYVEPHEIPSGRVDVVVTDGFTGNAVLKTMEGIGHFAHALLQRAARDGLVSRLGFALARSALQRHLRQTLDYQSQGGAPLLGVNGVVIAAHGRSSPTAISGAIRQAMRLASLDLPRRLGEANAGRRQTLEAV